MVFQNYMWLRHPYVRTRISRYYNQRFYFGVSRYATQTITRSETFPEILTYFILFLSLLDHKLINVLNSPSDSENYAMPRALFSFITSDV